MTGYLYQAFATDLNDRMRDNGKPNLEAVVEVHDIDIPPIAGFKSPNETPSPPMEPFKIFEDDRVRVSATLVDHAPVWPAFAYRFDTDDGSIVFSGDTGRCENLIKLAKGADVLVHGRAIARSALPSRTDIVSRACHVRKVPCVDGSGLARAFFTFCSVGRCSHVFGLLVRFT